MLKTNTQRSEVQDFLKKDAEAVTGWLDAYFACRTPQADRLQSAMKYSALNGGKRMRAALVCASARLTCFHSGTTYTPDVAHAVAGAVEMVHAYSLVHDDLPAMDDAELRRGKPSAHLAFDEATAILAGDALQTEAFCILSSETLAVSSDDKLALISLLATASGVDGMAGGQMLDLQAETSPLGFDEIRHMQSLKTGALIVASCQMGAVIGHADEALYKAISRYADHLGFAFQITDDLLDVRSDSGQVGKPVGRDAEQNKASVVTMMGVEEAEQAARALIDDAEMLLQPYGSAADELIWLANYTLSRTL